MQKDVLYMELVNNAICTERKKGNKGTGRPLSLEIPLFDLTVQEFQA